MKHSKYSKKHLAVCISAILSTGITTQALAQETQTNVQTAVEVQKDTLQEATPEDEVEVIEVKGIRGSLMRSMNVKKNMSGVVDAISSEEMGKFPDTNLAEALQRITGVTVSRTNGEGSQITVRGFGPDFNLVTLNGRQMPGTGNSRSYSFENLAADGVSALEVYKTSRAENPTGGLGGTVNIVTTKPLYNPGEKLSVSAKGIYDSSNVEGDDLTPELSALYSNTFLENSLGFGFSVNHQRRDFQQQSASVSGWQANVDLPTLAAENVVDARPLDSDGNPTGDYFFARNMNYSIADFQKERTNGHLIVQYAPIDDVVISADYTGTQSTTGTNSIGWGLWNEYGGNINAYELDENGTAIYTDTSGNDGSFTASRSTTEVKESSFGLNVDWQVSESLSVALDYHDSTSKYDNGVDKGLGSEGSLVLGSDKLKTKIYDFRTGEIPKGEVIWENGTTVLDTSDIDSHFSQFIHSPGESSVEQIQLDMVWENDAFDIGLVDAKFGMAHTKQTIGGSSAWSGLIGGFGFGTDYTNILPDGMFTLNDTGDLLNAFDGGGSQLGSYYTFDFDELVARSQAYLTNEELGGNDYFAPTAYHDMGTYSESEVEESTSSFYVDTAWEFDVVDLPVELNVGFRYEQTDVTSSVFQPVPTEVWWLGGSEWHTQYQDGENTFYSEEGDHDVFLPMFDLKVGLTDDLITRFSWGKTIARADLGYLAGGLTLSGSPKIGSRSGTQGDTNLQPYESTNLDLSLEYYYGEGSYASIGYYRKDVKNFIGNDVVSSSIDGIYDIYEGPRWNQAVSDLEANGIQATSDAIFAQIQANGSSLNAQGYLEPQSDDPLMLWNITKPINSSDNKTVQGIEVALQHLLGESGFGFGINATLVEGDVEFDIEDLSRQTPLTGIGDSANFQAFYEKHGWSVKVTYAWRDEQLIGVGQDQGSSDNPPQFAKEFGQWDMSINYDVNENFTVFAEGINLNNETEQGFGRYEEQFLFAREYGPRYAIGVRYSFE